MPKAAFNALVARLSLPPIPAVQSWARSYDGAHGPLIDLSQAVPGYPPHPDLLGWLADAAGSAAYAGYGAIEGDGVLRAAYATHVSELYGARLGAANVHLTAGCNQAFVAAVMAVAGPGDAVLMTNPCYFNHETTLQMMGVAPRYFECHAEAGFVPRVADVAAALDGVKALALVSPNNPTGAVYPPELLGEIFELCRERGVWLILDETYRDFIATGSGRPHGLFDVDGWEENLIQLYSFSKSFCIPGHRLGAITAGAEAVTQMAKVMDNLQICAPRAPQQAVARGLPALVEWREGNRLEIERRADAMRAAFASLPEWEMEAMGAYFAFVRHPFDGVDAASVAQTMARDLGVVTIPGSYFGTGLERHLRIAFANVDAEQIGEVAGRLRLMK
ncbi:aminotransferase [Mesorhizobium microcysteis]|uniref:aspartate transaminase n=1 Tax=Neoaquamicrobium microcysteis TaxID=2682781 RepID=A0A5D4GMM4_9HYPH|nr:aminotransferase [Mesorhizobium microcysteis]TYR30091.1 aminotransferase [Mesorhizobium microcysteis]